MSADNIDGVEIERRVLAGLKGFQRTTVDYVFRRMYEDAEPASRFLVADEVGLGKTLIARGLIARAIRHHQAVGTKRIDVIYICSNAEIAAQNIRRLNVTGEPGLAMASRITLLPLNLGSLSQNGVNFISFTPGTSFNMASRDGMWRERAVIFRLLEHALGKSLDVTAAYRAFRGRMGEDRFRGAVGLIPRVGNSPGQGLDIGLAEAFGTALAGRPELTTRIDDLIARLDSSSEDDCWHERQELIRDLRQTLARSCVDALEPDLVILDEFQRFRELLTEPDPEDQDDIRHLAHHLFRQQDVRTLLLSATPYKMYTLRDEEQDDHYGDFLKTANFLMGPGETQLLGEDLQTFRRALMEVGVTGDRVLMDRKRRIEGRLRRFIARTERVAIGSDGGGMLEDRDMPGTRLTAADLRSYAVADRVSREIGSGDVTDYWKSSPYLLNFMSDYKMKRSLRDASDSPAVVAAVDPSTLLRRAHVERYEELDSGNARLRGLAADIVDAGAWRLLWLPPSLPYYRGRGAYDDAALRTMTKRLIFSSWNVVPDAVSVMISYEAERQMMLSRDACALNTAEERAKLRGLLAIRRQGTEPAGMSTFGLLYPCAALAELVDPLMIARDLGAATGEVSADDVHGEATRRVREALSPLARRSTQEGAVDQRWHWAAPLLLDRRGRAGDATRAWLDTSMTVRAPGSAGVESDDETDAWADHVSLARQVLAREIRLGRMPDDLAESIALLGLGGPGTCALRAVARVLARIAGSRPDHLDTATRDAALRIAWGFRSLFNVPEVMSLLRGPSDGADEVYWRRTAEEGLSGNLQAVLDEYVHLLPEWLGLIGVDGATIAEQIGHAIHDAVSIRAANYRPDELQIGDDGITFAPMPMRARFALRFGRDTTDDQAVLQRSRAVRSAFNSPFWPFVLTSTSVGQEGLDFHQYCHAVVHWNLPANPVDLEQREGRVHRYKGHAIRKNLAERHRSAAFGRRATDPWEAMFAEAVRGAPRHGLRGMEPFWIYEGSSRIERHVPLLPLSREVEQLARLRRSLAVYRLVFGQPRQEDIADYLRDRLPPAELEILVKRLRIDLTPRA